MSALQTKSTAEAGQPTDASLIIVPKIVRVANSCFEVTTREQCCQQAESGTLRNQCCGRRALKWTDVLLRTLNIAKRSISPAKSCVCGSPVRKG
jgi:hypothetical protein